MHRLQFTKCVYETVTFGHKAMNALAFCDEEEEEEEEEEEDNNSITEKQTFIKNEQ